MSWNRISFVARTTEPVRAELQLAQDPSTTLRAGYAEGGVLGRPVVRTQSRLLAGGTRRRVPPLRGSDPYKTRTQGFRPGLTSVSPRGLRLRQSASQPKSHNVGGFSRDGQVACPFGSRLGSFSPMGALSLSPSFGDRSLP